VLELREFRAHHKQLIAAGLSVVAVTRDRPEANAKQAGRLRLPYPVLSDTSGDVGRAFGVVRSVGIGPWQIEFFRRSTFLADIHGTVSAVWRDVKIRGHALKVMDVARALSRPPG